MPLAHWFQPPRRVLAVFVAVIAAFAGTLTWLGWQFLENNRSIEDRRVQDQLANAADEVAAALKLRLDALKPRADLQPPPPGVVRLTIEGDRISATPPHGLAYYPQLPPVEDVAADVAENVAGSAPAADTGTPRDAVRAAALLQQGLVLRHSGHYDEALRSFGRLAAFGATRLDQIPAELLARESRCRVFEQLGRTRDLQREASLIQAGLDSNPWILLRPAREFYSAEAARCGARPSSSDRQRDAQALAVAAEWLYGQRNSDPPFDPPLILKSAGYPVLLLWDRAGLQFRATLASPTYLAAAIRSQDRAVLCRLLDRDGRVLIEQVNGEQVKSGGPDRRGPTVVRAFYGTALGTGISWNVSATLADPGADRAGYTARRHILFWGFAVVGLVLAAGSYYILRSIAHEQAVARLQADFVSAVSHELRTPLSSIVQISELLAADRIPRDQAGTSFEHLVRESRRLHKLVESLLDFRRMESGAASYSLEAIDGKSVEAWLRGVISEFEPVAAAAGHRIGIDIADPLPAIRADRESLSLAVRNLLDNAVKYSPGSPEIEVRSAADGDRVIISVQDHGVGIPRSEHQDVFKNFFPGSAARRVNVKGTGIGLAMVRHVLAAHHGEVTLTSEPGDGSTFSLLLPVETAR